MTLTDEDFTIVINGVDLTLEFGLLNVKDLNDDSVFESKGKVVRDILEKLRNEGSKETKTKDDIILW